MEGAGELEMVVPRRGPGRPRSAEADRAILAATVALLAEAGFAAITMERVASSAGVGKATVYRRWASKVDLVIDAIRTGMHDIEPPGTGSLRQDLVTLMSVQIDWLRDSDTGRMVAGLSAEIQHNAELADALRTNLIISRRAVVRRLLADAVLSGEVRSDADLDVVLDLLYGAIHFRVLVTGEPLEADLASKIVDAVLVGAC
jgi:AcrR family transcriptional regulator